MSSYTKTIWVNGSAPSLNARNLNKIEQGIYNCSENKVDKQQGKGLSTNDYTNDAVSKVAKISGLESKVESLPIESGTATASIVQKGGLNQAISKGAIALGGLNVAGRKVYYWNYINFNTKTIYLCNTPTSPLSTEPAIDPTFENHYTTGDTYSLRDSDKYYDCGTIETIEHNKIVVSSLPRTTYKTQDGTKHYFFVLDKPQYGVFDYAEGAEVYGYNNKSLGVYSHVEGEECVGVGSHAHVEGYQCMVYGDEGHAEGNASIVTGKQGHAEGHSTRAVGTTSHAEGDGTIASGQFSHVEGVHDIVSNVDYGVSIGYASHSEGKTRATGDYSHSEGYRSKATGESSHAEGGSTEATGTRSHAEGGSSKAQSLNSHAEGEGTIARAQGAHVEGYHKIVGSREFGVAEGKWSHSEGCSHTEGQYSHTEGYGTRTYNEAEHAEGSFNVSHTGGANSENTISSIGIGNATASKNAFEVMQNGDAYLFGLGGYNGTNPMSSVSLQNLIWKGTQAEYDAISSKNPNIIYLIFE